MDRLDYRFRFSPKAVGAKDRLLAKDVDVRIFRVGNPSTFRANVSGVGE
jgi:hypothetical protein